MLEHGGDVYRRFWGEDTALERAVRKGIVGMVELMLQHKPGEEETGDGRKAER